MKLLWIPLLLTAAAWGQGAGSLTGKVTDSAGNGKQDVTIILTDPSTGMSQRAVTGSDGAFNITNVAPGNYRIAVETPNRGRAGEQNVTVLANSPTQISLTFTGDSGMQGAVGPVEIKAVSPTIQTDSAEVSRAYTSRPVRSLPLQDRQVQELIGLMPGVTPPVVSQDRILDPQRTRSFNVNGTPDWANAFYQDGAYTNEQYNANSSRILPLEAVQQLNIRTANYNAEYGFAGGAWTNVVTRPGTNGLHGSLFEFNQNSFFETRNPLNVTGNAEPRFNQNQFGGTFGAPVIKDRLFFFGSYEGTLRRGNELQIATVPTADLRAGNFSGISGAAIYNPASGATGGTGRQLFGTGQIPGSQISPAAAALLGYLPLPNQPGLTNNLIGNRGMREDDHRVDAKVDHRFNDWNTGFFRYGFTQADLSRGSVLGPLGDAANAALRNHSAVASLTQSYSPTFLGEYRVGFNRYRNLITAGNQNTALNNTLAGLGFNNGLPEINIAGFNGFGLNGNYPSKLVNDNYTGDANFNWHTGMHRLKFGASVYSLQASGFDPGAFSPRGTFNFGPGGTASPSAFNSLNTQANAFGSFLLGAPTTAGVSTFLTTPTYNQMLYAGYITDTINLWQKLSIELGVRYDVYSPVTTRRQGGATFFDRAANTLGFGNGDIVDYDLNNVAPRVGFAFSPSRRFVVRGGYAFQYFPLPFTLSGLNQTALAAQAGLAGSFGTTQFAVPQISAPNGFGNAGTTISGSNVPNAPYNTTRMSGTTPYVQSYSLMVQSDLGAGFLFDIGYVGTLGRELPFSRNLNSALPGAGAAGLPFASINRTAAVNDYALGANSNYNSLQVNLTKRMAYGLAFSGAYTWSKALDTGFNQLNPFSRQANYAVADFDRQHVLSLSHTWALPFGANIGRFNHGAMASVLGGWELNGILRWATGTPYSVTTDPLFCNCPGGGTLTANFAGGTDLSGAASFNPGLFSTPQPGVFGGTGRNQFRGPDLFNYNLAVLKTFPVGENFRLEFRGEAYNLTNTTNYSLPVSTLGAPGFGRPLSLYNGLGGRTFQLAARLLF